VFRPAKVKPFRFFKKSPDLAVLGSYFLKKPCLEGGTRTFLMPEKKRKLRLQKIIN
jgi:hypothetical protein